MVEKGQGSKCTQTHTSGMYKVQLQVVVNPEEEIIHFQLRYPGMLYVRDNIETKSESMRSLERQRMGEA